MAKKDQLRLTRAGTIINSISKKQEVDIGEALRITIETLESKYAYQFTHKRSVRLSGIVKSLTKDFPEEVFHYHFATSEMRPDGGILYIEDKEKNMYPVLISEVKNQGTNDKRKEEGLKKQAKGNAIERLGKNVIGFRTYMLKESIIPFVCFGYGCDFSDNSSILDRVSTIAMFGSLNQTHLHGTSGDSFKRGSFYFREEVWSVDEMVKIMLDIADRSILYYMSKYKTENIVTRSGDPLAKM